MISIALYLLETVFYLNIIQNQQTQVDLINTHSNSNIQVAVNRRHMIPLKTERHFSHLYTAI